MPIPEQILTPEAFLAVAEAGGVVLDVRAPGEFAAGHLPGAVSFPLFSDEERARVGTVYKQESKQAAVDLGLELVGPKLRDLAARARALFEAQDARTPLLVHCWRGGMRSGSVDWLLRTAEVPAARCQGGYKACRAVLRPSFQAARPYVVLGGMTGTAKTDVIHALTAQKERTLDLEGMARHFGSSFGNLDAHPQPTTEQFSNDLAWALRALDRDGREDPVWVENESRSIGWVQMPEDFHKRLRSAPVLELERTEDDRISHLLSMYGEADEEALVQAFERIRTKLGGQHANTAIAHVCEGNLAEAAKIALVYYDKTYRHGLDKREQMRAVQAFGLNPADTADACRHAHTQWNPWNLQATSN
jgi:tRNA 2-selenouridine synthase